MRLIKSGLTFDIIEAAVAERVDYVVWRIASWKYERAIAGMGLNEKGRGEEWVSKPDLIN